MNIFIYIEDLISGALPFTFLMLTGVYLSLKGRFFQIFKLRSAIKLTVKAFKEPKVKGEITSFQSACTALSSTVGTGNIAGVASAVSLGGPGAVFWMWISALCGMAVKFGEIALAVEFREMKPKYKGGPMYVAKNAAPKGLKLLGVVFCLAGIPTVICNGNMTQINAAAVSLGESVLVKALCGTVFCILTALIIFGGTNRIINVVDKLVPLMSLGYVIMSLIIIFLNIDFLPTAFKMIFKGAFTPRAVTGGAVGSVFNVMTIGASKGVFSNEAGLGTSAMAHSAAVDADKSTQGLFGIVEVFIDTIVLCTLTALTILCSRVKINYGLSASVELVKQALGRDFRGASSLILSLMMCVFAFSSIIGWAFYGDLCADFLFGRWGRRAFKLIYPLFCIVGAVLKVSFTWRISAFFNGIMLCSNLPLVLLLSNNFLKGNEENGKKNKKFARDVKG